MCTTTHEFPVLVSAGAGRFPRAWLILDITPGDELNHPLPSYRALRSRGAVFCRRRVVSLFSNRRPGPEKKG